MTTYEGMHRRNVSHACNVCLPVSLFVCVPFLYLICLPEWHYCYAGTDGVMGKKDYKFDPPFLWVAVVTITLNKYMN